MTKYKLSNAAKVEKPVILTTLFRIKLTRLFRSKLTTPFRSILTT